MPLIQNYLDYLLLEKRYSSHTVKAYRTDLKLFQSYLKEIYTISIDKTNHAMIRSWLVEELNNGNSARTVNRKITSLKSFFKYLVKEEVIKDNPTLKISSSKTSKKLPQFVGLDDMNKLLDKLNFNNEYSGKRDKLIIEIFYSTGIRLSELINIKLKDVDTIKSQVKVLGKRNKERIIPLTKELKKSIDNYMGLRMNEKAIDRSYLLLTDSGKKLNPSMVYRKVNDLLKGVTTIDKKSPHILRHTFATHMLNNGADLNVIKELLGHASLSATEVYTHNSIGKLKQIFNNAHPRA
ncbi:MAG: tyrosine-type recombinase/integrase [Flavobacteriales bacterium]|jgi:integrase/recombinase XerC|nr:tyrosine-type recombinase/integrase [Flavobacteriales bacterium]|tara:strand:- start:701 stop:1582 length:882 start_codon:yes stop_codon:yes gene_type:complete